ncbi:MAG: hypothetical protein ACTSVC_15690 [Promethearchaeota archaeon]
MEEDDEDKTDVLDIFELRTQIDSLNIIFDMDYLNELNNSRIYGKKKISEPYISLISRNPIVKNKKIFIIRDRGYKIGNISYESSEIKSDILEIDWLYIDPGKRLNDFGIIIYPDKSKRTIEWLASGLIYYDYNRKDWIVPHTNYVSGTITPKSKLMGFLGPWFAIQIYGYI